MKKLLIVNDNLELGGIQKSLLNLLAELNREYEITLCLLYQSGPLLEKVPENVRVISAAKSFGVLGAIKKSLEKNPFLYLWKGGLCVLAKLFSKKTAVRFASFFQKKMTGYDTVISYSHASAGKRLTSCCAEFVLDKVSAAEKICFIHCDYSEENNHCVYTDKLYASFDKIACCSESVKERFLSVLPQMSEKTFTVRNFYDLNLKKEAERGKAFVYEKEHIHLVSIARMTEEKGLERAIRAFAECGRQDLYYYIAGDGPERTKIEKVIEEKGLSDRITLWGNVEHPELYLKNADYLFVPSFHEAAPMVFDEAKLLDVSVITTETASAREMIGEQFGIVCGNSLEGIREALSMLKKPERQEKDGKGFTNELQRTQFRQLLADKK